MCLTVDGVSSNLAGLAAQNACMWPPDGVSLPGLAWAASWHGAFTMAREECLTFLWSNFFQHMVFQRMYSADRFELPATTWKRETHHPKCRRTAFVAEGPSTLTPRLTIRPAEAPIWLPENVLCASCLHGSMAMMSLQHLKFTLWDVFDHWKSETLLFR